MRSTAWNKFAFGSWPFIWGGLAVGAAEAIHYLKYKQTINISYALANVASVLEEKIEMEPGLFSRNYSAGVSGVFLGIIAGGLLAALFEKQRQRVKYPARTLAFAFLGGVLSGFGAVLAEGDTLFHFIGGVAFMQSSSLFIAAFAIPFVFLALELMAVLGTAPSFQVNEGFGGGTSSDPQGNQTAGLAGSLGASLPGLAAVAILALIAVWQGGSDIVLVLLGILAGLGVARSGFGIEWSLLGPDALASSPRYLSQLGLTDGTIRELRRPSALQAWLIAVSLLSVTGLIAWLADGSPAGLAAQVTDGRGLHIGHVAGAPLLAMGSVFMIGCDFRSYARLGVGYLTAPTAIAGLLVGYIPGAIWGGTISGWTRSNMIAVSSWLPESLTRNSSVWMVLWLCFIAALLFVALMIHKAFAKNS